MAELERVEWPGLELRLADTEDGRTVSGIAVPYGEITEHAPFGAERFLPGSLKKTVNDRRAAKNAMKVFRSHQYDVPIGHVMTWDDQPEGLHVTVRLADTTAGRAAAEEAHAGTLDSFSIGFRAIKDRVTDGVREVVEAALHEISLVALPAYAGALVTDVREAVEPRYVTVPDMPQVPARLLRNPQLGGYTL